MSNQHDSQFWRSIKERMERSNRALDSFTSVSSEENESILRARAQSLARSGAQEERGRWVDAVVFGLAGERYAIEYAFLEEALALRRYTPLPFTPDFVAGVLNVRGQIVSCIDIRAFFGIERRGIGELNKVLILASPAMKFGILVDTLEGNQRLNLDALQTGVHTITEGDGRRSYIRGVTGERLIVLDAMKLLSDRRIVVDAGEKRDGNTYKGVAE